MLSNFKHKTVLETDFQVRLATGGCCPPRYARGSCYPEPIHAHLDLSQMALFHLWLVFAKG